MTYADVMIKLGASGSPCFFGYDPNCMEWVECNWDGRGIISVTSECFDGRLYGRPQEPGDTFSMLGHDFIVIDYMYHTNDILLCMTETFESHMIYINRMLHRRELHVWFVMKVRTCKVNSHILSMVDIAAAGVK